MHVATEDERDRLTRRMTFPVHVQASQILWIEAQLDASQIPRLAQMGAYYGWKLVCRLLDGRGQTRCGSQRLAGRDGHVP